MDIITTHKGSDFDALASLVAATLVYPGASPVLPASINGNLKAFLSIHKDLFDFYAPGDINADRVKRLIVVDTHSWERLEGLDSLRGKEDLEIIVWDHHTEGDMKASEAHIAETGATVTLLVNEIKNRRILITPIQATLFLMGLYEDTGNMTFPSTLPEDAYAAGFLLDRRADLNILSTFLRQAYGKKQKDILFEMIQKAERQEVGGFSISISRMEIEGRVDPRRLDLLFEIELLGVTAGGFPPGTRFQFRYDLWRPFERPPGQAGATPDGGCREVVYRSKLVPNLSGGAMGMVQVPECRR